MRLSDLLETVVIDLDGREVGRVHDVRLVQDAPVAGEAGARFRVLGLIVGPGAYGERLGFTRASVRGPAPLKALFRWLHRDAHLVPWEAIRAIENRRILVSARLADLGPVPPIDITRS